MRVRQGLLACLLALGGCVALNEGATDIRRPGDTVSDWFVSTGAPGRNAIGPNETVLITIDQMYIQEFEELNFEPSRLPGRGMFQARGEVAVLVGVPGTTGPASFTSTSGHYLVFYSNDVVEGQFLNLRNQRVFGPSAVGADRMEIEFLVLELDRTSTQEQALLQNLADLGKAYAGMGGPVGSVLTDLGASMLSAQNDDVEMRYRFTFDLGTRSGARLPLLPGFYVALRDDRRPWVPVDWATICLSRESGQLYTRKDKTGSATFSSRQTAGGGFCPTSQDLSVDNLFQSQSYVVFHVEQGVPATNQAMTTFSAFGTELAAIQSPSISAVNTAIERVQADYLMDFRKRAIWDALGAMDSAAATYGSLRQQAVVDPTFATARDAAKAALTRTSTSLYRLLAEAAGSIAAPPAGTVAYDKDAYEEQIERLIDFFGSLDWATPTGTEAVRLADSPNPAQYAAVFGTSAEFVANVQAEADADWP